MGRLEGEGTYDQRTPASLSHCSWKSFRCARLSVSKYKRGVSAAYGGEDM
jgi:hypothetical protein